MKVDIYVNPLNYTSFKGSCKTSYTPKESKEFDFLDTEKERGKVKACKVLLQSLLREKKCLSKGKFILMNSNLLR